MTKLPPDIEEAIDRVDRQGNRDLLPKTDTNLEKYDQLLQKAFPNFQVVNITEFDYGRSFRYAIALTENKDAAVLDIDYLRLAVQQEGQFDKLLLAISAISNYAHIQFVRYSWKNGEVIQEWSDKPLNELQLHAWEKLSSFLSHKGFIQIKPEIAATVVIDVQTDLCDPGEATVADCLFYG